MTFNQRPHITEVVTTDEPGYRVRTLCHVDGFPAYVDLDVNTRRQEYSTFTIKVFDPTSRSWDVVWNLLPDEVGHMPVIGDQPDTLVRLNEIADVLWHVATEVMRTARQRYDMVDAIGKQVERRTADLITEVEMDIMLRTLDEEYATNPDFAVTDSDARRAALRAHRERVAARAHPDDTRVFVQADGTDAEQEDQE